MTDDEIRRLPTLLTVPDAARVLGVGRTVAYQLVRRGQWPSPVIRIGSQFRIPRAPLLELLGLSPTPPSLPPPSPPRRTIRSRHPNRKGADGGHHVQEMLLP
jgi:excisionase family DNA binding protein